MPLKNYGEIFELYAGGPDAALSWDAFYRAMRLDMELSEEEVPDGLLREMFMMADGDSSQHPSLPLL